MKNKHLLSSALIAIGIAVASPVQATVVVTDDPVLYWNQLAALNLTGSPVATSRTLSMVGVAIRDAANASLGSPSPSYLGPLATPGGDTRAATSVAARNLLVALNPAKTADYDAALAASLALVADGQAKEDGKATGAAIATAMIARSTGDGSSSPSSYAPTGLIGDWEPTPPGLLGAAAPQWGGVTPWFMSSSSQFRPVDPPALDSAAYATAYNEVKDVGSASSLTRTIDQTLSAQFWATAGAQGSNPWILTGVDLAKSKGLTTLESANLLALLETSVADSVIGIFDAKYYFDYWRPVSAINKGEFDGNAATVGDPNWLPLIVTPNHPSYISGHSGVASSAATVMTALLGDNIDFCFTSGALQRCWSSFDDAAEDAANSRLWGGIHWRFDNEQGTALGRSVAQLGLTQSVFAAVPEPATWTMLIGGFAMVGGGVRRRRVSYSLA